MGDERELKAAVSCHRAISRTAYALTSQAACRVISLSTFADSKYGRFDAQDDVFEGS